MRGMRARTRDKKEKDALDMISPTSFYSSQEDKVKLNWFCYELSLSIYGDMKSKISSRLKKKKISDVALAEFSIFYAKKMKDEGLKQLSGEIEKVCISYEGDKNMRGMKERRKGKKEKVALDMISPTSFYSCQVCPNRCISEKDAFCTIFDDKHMFRER